MFLVWQARRVQTDIATMDGEVAVVTEQLA